MVEDEQILSYAAIFAVTPAPLLVLTPDLVICEANQAYLDAVGRRRDELLGRYMFDVFPRSDDPDGFGMVNVKASMERALQSGRPDTMALQRYDIPSIDGGFVRRYWSPIHVPVKDGSGRVVLLLHRAVDVTDFVSEQRRVQGERAQGQAWRRRMEDAEADLFSRARELQALNDELREARDELAVQALHEPLTGLLIRPVMVELVAHALSGLARRAGPVAVLFIDLDGLKQVNDVHGHAAGDALIRCFAEQLRGCVRPDDPIARVGGDEFIVLLENLDDGTGAMAVAQRVIASLSACQTAAGLPVRPRASVGIAVADGGDVGADTLINQADAAMYRAKRAGGDRCEVFDEPSYAAESTRDRLRGELAAALGTDQLRLHHQPILDLSTGALHAVEALLRWQHPTRGLLEAADFLDLAENTGLIIELGRWVISEACRQLAQWQHELADRAPSRLFLNLSTPELAQGGLSEYLAVTAAAAGISPERLVLEVTETGMLQESHALARAVDPLLALGCDLAIDDFGTGHSSLTRLVQLPASILKIDRSFVQQLTSGGTAVAIVRTILQLARTLDLDVVAEGVEDAETAAALRQLGCRYAQGYHLARPAPAQQITDSLSAAGRQG